MKILKITKISDTSISPVTDYGTIISYDSNIPDNDFTEFHSREHYCTSVQSREKEGRGKTWYAL